MALTYPPSSFGRLSTGNPLKDLQLFGQAIYQNIPKDRDILNTLGLPGLAQRLPNPSGKGGYLGPAYGDPDVLIGDGGLANLPVNTTQVTPGWRARDSALEEMAQQHDPNYWDRKENEAIRAATLADADRTDGTLRVTSDMEGYEDRADIQAWLAAASPEIKEKFLADRARKAEAGLLQPNPNVNPDTAALAEDAGRTVEDMTKILSPEGLETVFSPQPPTRDEPLWPGPGDPQPPSNQQLAETFLRDRMGPFVGGLERVDQTLEDLAGQLGGHLGQEKAKKMPFGETPVLGDLMQDYGRTKGTEAGKDEYNKKKQQLRQLFLDRIPVSRVNFQR